MSPRAWAVARLVGGAAILGVIVWRLGTGPVVDGLRAVDGPSIVAALVLTAITTAAAAYRWSRVAGGLDVGVPWRAAVVAYYRSQFLNTALPGGILGDAHRAVRHGQDVGDVGRAARAVVEERIAGQVVQGLLTLVVLAALPSPVRHTLPLVLAIAAAAVLVVSVLVRRGRGRVVRTLVADLRAGVWARDRRRSIAAASCVVVAGHTAVFLIAARTAGTDAPLTRLLPLAMLVLLAMAVPTNVGGWGPREGAAAWLFGAAGLGAAQGVAAATVYGVLVLVAASPGAVVLVLSRRRRGTVRAPEKPTSVRRPVGAAHG